MEFLNLLRILMLIIRKRFGELLYALFLTCFILSVGLLTVPYWQTPTNATTYEGKMLLAYVGWISNIENNGLRDFAYTWIKYVCPVILAGLLLFWGGWKNAGRITLKILLILLALTFIFLTIPAWRSLLTIKEVYLTGKIGDWLETSGSNLRKIIYWWVSLFNPLIMFLIIWFVHQKKKNL